MLPNASNKQKLSKIPRDEISLTLFYSPSLPEKIVNKSSSSCSLYQQQLAHQQALFNQWQHAAGSQYGGQYGGAYGGAGAAGGVPTGFYAPNFAASSGSVGPGGIHQTATLIPANPVS